MILYCLVTTPLVQTPSIIYIMFFFIEVMGGLLIIVAKRLYAYSALFKANTIEAHIIGRRRALPQVLLVVRRRIS